MVRIPNNQNGEFMPRPNPRGYQGGPESGTFLRQLDGHRSTDRYDTGDEPTDTVESFQNAHKLGDDDLI